MGIAERDPTRRTAGQHARAVVERLRLRTLAALGVAAVCTAVLGRAFGLHDVRFLGSEVALLVTIFVVWRYVLPLLARRDRGATGEEEVGGLLDQLPRDRWRVIHDASFGHGNIDHILIGPAGVFTIETKSHPGPVRVRRIHGATLRQATAERQRIEEITGEPAEALIVFSRAWVDRPLARRKGVRVVPARLLLRYLRNHRVTLSQREVERARARVGAALSEYPSNEHRVGLSIRRGSRQPARGANASETLGAVVRRHVGRR